MFLRKIDYYNISKIDNGSILDYQLEHLLYALDTKVQWQGATDTYLCSLQSFFVN